VKWPLQYLVRIRPCSGLGLSIPHLFGLQTDVVYLLLRPTISTAGDSSVSLEPHVSQTSARCCDEESILPLPKVSTCFKELGRAVALLEYMVGRSHQVQDNTGAPVL
jgi:hypothetical protein